MSGQSKRPGRKSADKRRQKKTRPNTTSTLFNHSNESPTLSRLGTLTPKIPSLPKQEGKNAWDNFIADLKIWLLHNIWGRLHFRVLAILLFLGMGVLKLNAECPWLIPWRTPSHKSVSNKTQVVKSEGPASSVTMGESESKWSIDWPEERELAYNEPACATLRVEGLDTCTKQYWIDDSLQNLTSPAGHLTWDNNRFSYTPRCGYWQPGYHTIRMRYSRSDLTVIKSTYTFGVQWDLDFREPSGDKNLLMDPRMRSMPHGLVYTDSQTGELVLAPKQVDSNNPSYIMSAPFTRGVDNYKIYLYFRISKPIAGGFQVALPGQLEIQVGDGSTKDITLKVRGKYLDTSGFPTQNKKRKAWRLRTRELDNSGTEKVLVVSMHNSCLEVALGCDESKPLFWQTIPPNVLVNDGHNLALRSYGSEVRFSRIIIRPYDWPPQ